MIHRLSYPLFRCANSSRPSLSLRCVGFLCLIIFLARECRAQLPPNSVRRTPLVNVIENAEKTVVALFSFDQATSKGAAGTGSVIHSLGYVLTNDHILPTKTGQAVYQGRAIPFRVVGRIPEYDIAMVKLESNKAWPHVVVGQNKDLMNGETVITAGNPGGRGVVFTSGIVSNKKLISNAPNALVMTVLKSDQRPSFIQFDAASNHGSSGGPLLDLDSRLIGIVSGGFKNEQNGNYAIPIDRVRRTALSLIEPEIRHQKRTGIVVDPDAKECQIANVSKNSVAHTNNLLPGEVIKSVNGMATNQILDWVIALDVLLPDTDTLKLEVAGQDGLKEVSLQLDPLPAWPSAQGIANTKPGLAFKLYEGHFEKLPEFRTLAIENQGTIDELSLAAMTANGREDFAAQLDGYLKIEQDGLFRITINSDDGSKLYLHDELLLENDFSHPPQAVSNLTRLTKGLHPIRIDYFQGRSSATLELKIASVNTRTWEETSVPLQLVREQR
jgi:S1-C subfamily serine protease